MTDALPQDEGDRPVRKPIWPIIRAVADDFGLTLDEMVCERRDQRIARPRQVAMWLARNESLATFARIGRALGKRDHTTILHGCRVVETMIARDSAFAERIAKIKARCEMQSLSPISAQQPTRRTL